MKLHLAFVVPGVPVPKERPRVFTPKGAKFPIATTPPKTRAFEGLVKLYAQQAVARNGAWGAFAKEHPTGRLYRVQLHFVLNADRGDWENFAKAVLDAMNGVAYADDRQILQATVSLFIHKRAVARSEIVVELVETQLDRPLWMQMAMEAGWLPPRPAERSA